jgi:ribosomal protein S18 acetylase RimI-like enzyme
MVDGIAVRKMEQKDIEGAIDMVLRLKKLNAEFDSSFVVRENIGDEIRRYLAAATGDEKGHIVLVADAGHGAVGMIKVDILDRIGYEPRKEARIVEFYIMPEHRRKAVGHALLEELTSMLRERGISLVSAEFPSMNDIAVGFYKKKGFRNLVSIYGKQIEG